MIRISGQYVWQVIFTIFFVALVTMGAIILDSEARISLPEITLFDLLIITLASWRLTRLVVYDAITKFFREQFFDVVKVEGGYILEKPKTGPRRTLNELLSCPWCFGVWAAAMITFFYLFTEWSLYPVYLLAVAAVATFMQLVANTVGHQAEKLKRENGG